MKSVRFGLSLVILLLVFSCKKDKQDDGNGKIVFRFNHVVDNQNVVFDTLLYVNAAGNHYSLTDFRYFISDVTLIRADGDRVLISKDKDIYYVDSQIPSTYTWEVSDDIPAGIYDSITFTFGINEAKNKNGLFINPPEVNMFWPDFLGGGYHLMQMNGMWIDTGGNPQPFNFHLGIGRDTTNTGTIVFKQNYFETTLPSSGFSMGKNKKLEINVVMNIDSWFKTPHIWDWNVIGGAIMQNQAAMNMAKENGYDVFTVGQIKEIQ